MEERMNTQHSYDHDIDHACDQITEAIYQVEDYQAEIEVIDQALDALHDEQFLKQNEDAILNDYRTIAEEYKKRAAIVEGEIHQIESMMQSYHTEEEQADAVMEEIQNKKKLYKNATVGCFGIGAVVFLLIVVIQLLKGAFMPVTMVNVLLLTGIAAGICYILYTKTFDDIKIANQVERQSTEADAKWRMKLQNEKNQLALCRMKIDMEECTSGEEILASLEQQKEMTQGFIEYNQSIQEKNKKRIRYIMAQNPDLRGYIENLLKSYEDIFTL
ncbi:MAG: hypothetical protein ACI4CT_03435 [Lachnospiraceae bacterium]